MAYELHSNLAQPPSPLREGFAKADDGTLLYYNVTGPADRRPLPAALVLNDGIACDQYVWRYIVGQLARERLCVRWNLRGHGRSGIPAHRDKVGVEDSVDDVRAVMDEVGLDTAVIAGHSMGVQISLEFYRKYGERAVGLILLCGAPGRPVDTFQDSDTLARAFPLLYLAFTMFPRAVGALWSYAIPSALAVTVAGRGQVNLQMMRIDEFVGYLKHAGTLDVDLFMRMLNAARLHDASDVLPHVRVPALVGVAENDLFTPVWRGVEMAEGIPGAELLHIPGAGHAAPVELPELVNLRIAKFLRSRIDMMESEQA